MFVPDIKSQERRDENQVIIAWVVIITDPRNYVLVLYEGLWLWFLCKLQKKQPEFTNLQPNVLHTNGIVIENETYGLSPRFAGFFLWHCWRHSNKVLYYELCFWWHQKRNHKITNSMCCVKAIEPFKIPLIVYYFSPSFFTLKRHFAALWIGSFMLLYLVLLYVRRLRKFDHICIKSNLINKL